MRNLSEQYFLQKCIVSAEDAKGSYSMMANLDVEYQVKQMYEKMLADIGRHIKDLDGRLKYLKEHN